MLLTLSAFGHTPAESFDRVVLLACVCLQVCLLLTSVAPVPKPLSASLVSLCHFGLVSAMAYAVVAGHRPTLMLATGLLVFVLLTRWVMGGCMFAAFEHDGHSASHRAAHVGWQLAGLLTLGALRLAVLRANPRRDVQMCVAFGSSVLAACAWCS